MAAKAKTDSADRTTGGWRQNLKVAGYSIIYAIPLVWLWHKQDFPDGFGVHINAHGRSGLIENWWYSYLLLQRHDVLDVVSFLYMWAPVAGFFGWLIWMQVTKGRRDDEKTGVGVVDAPVASTEHEL